MTATAKYSGKPLAEKLGLKAGQTILAIDPPPDYAALLAPLPLGAVITSVATSADIAHAFARNPDYLLEWAERLVAMPKQGAPCGFSGPRRRRPCSRD